METIITDFDLKIRYQIYRFFADNCRAPSYQELAALLNAEQENVRASFHKLHLRHMIFLEPGADTIRMANPFSAIPTKYKVISGNKKWCTAIKQSTSIPMASTCGLCTDYLLLGSQLSRHGRMALDKREDMQSLKFTNHTGSFNLMSRISENWN